MSCRSVACVSVSRAASVASSVMGLAAALFLGSVSVSIFAVYVNSFIVLFSQDFSNFAHSRFAIGVVGLMERI